MEIQQRSEDWFKARLGKATASRFVDVMMGDKYAGFRNYKAELVAERTTGIRYSELTGRNFTTWEMQWGIDNEEMARLEYRTHTGRFADECGFFVHEHLEAGASPDGLIGEDGVLEIKCPNTATHIETLQNQKVPNKYYAQVQGQLLMTKREWADFVSYDPRLPENARFICIRVERDEEYIEKLTRMLSVFLDEVDHSVGFIQNYGRK